MKAAIIAVGSEMLGPVRVDTNSLKITAMLEDYGLELMRKTVVGDHLDELAEAIGYDLAKADIVFTSGGLGPTDDDLTREALGKALGLELVPDHEIAERLVARFAARDLVMPEVNRRQANVFRGQTTLKNERGTAPGFQLQLRGKHVWVFPGVPHELEWMLETYLRPWLESVSGGRQRYRRVLKVAGMTESAVEERLAPYYAQHGGERLTILASGGQIELHLVATGREAAARGEIASRERELLELFGRRVFGYDDDTLEGVVGRLLMERRETLSTAESCTGGLLASRITDAPGSSAYFLGGGVCYHADAKVAVAGVDRELIRAHGEVSEEVAIALAQGIRERFTSSWGIGVTGIAGPSGGTEGKPVGTVHIAVAGPEGAQHRKLFWPMPRPFFKWFTTQSALDLLRVQLLA